MCYTKGVDEVGISFYVNPNCNKATVLSSFDLSHPGVNDEILYKTKKLEDVLNGADPGCDDVRNILFLNRSVFSERQLVEFAKTWEQGIAKSMIKVWNAPILNISCCLFSISNVSGPFQYARILVDKRICINGGKMRICSIVPDDPNYRNPGERPLHISEIFQQLFGVGEGIKLIAVDQRDPELEVGKSSQRVPDSRNQESITLEGRASVVFSNPLKSTVSPPIKKRTIPKVLEKPRKKRAIHKRVYPCCGKSGGTSFHMCSNYGTHHECPTPWWHKKCIGRIPSDLWLCKNCRIFYQ